MGSRPIGTLFAGRYRVDALLAEGGAAVVYRGTDLERGDEVAIKELRQEFGRDEEIRRRFRREASILRALRHDAIVRILDDGDDDGVLYVVMELLHGCSLREELESVRCITPATWCEWLHSIGEALDEAHAQGIVHGDLKPENCFLERLPNGERRIKLLDFGMAKILGLDRLTRTGEVAGTPLYMAPELILGSSDVDGRTDVYALGVMTFEALTGQRPFTERQPARLLAQIVGGDSRSMENVGANVSPNVERSVARAMGTVRDRRFASASEFAAELARALD
ncbi:MAG: serine/threonine-protein kinase [Polyangiales bacterium]|nr:serine/threonine protein kinase [Myxococcales bacterium]